MRIARYLGALVVSAGIMLATSGSASAECTGPRPPWPAFTEVAPNAKRIIVGTVIEDLTGSEPVSDTGEYLPSAWFRLRVDEVLRGDAPDQLVIRRLPSGVSLKRYPSCGETALVSARVGDVIAIAYRGHRPGGPRVLNTAAWIQGTPRPDFMRDAEQLSLAHVRRLASKLPDTSSVSSSNSGPVPDYGTHALLVTVAILTGLFVAARFRPRSGRRQLHGP